ncbi:MAG TPA: ABC transporter permease, partial [Pseudoneobacillus sp.]|nr:ABC transporter permease [Pseudoneobacillus sp.]
MSINHLIFRNLKKNIKNYYLYVFALIFSVSLYFAFVTLQYDPALDHAKGTIKGAASLRAASILLVGIVSVFLLYANNIFIKRRSKEIGLFQLIGMTKSRIFRILTAENFILYFSSMFIGIFVGFAGSRLILMILFKITRVEAAATLQFAPQAFYQTVIVFSAIYMLIMMMNHLFIKRQSILALFRVISSTEGKVKKLSIFEMIIGTLGLVLVGAGYYISSKLFGGDFTKMTELFLAMTFILGSVILGTYLIYKGTVSFIFHTIRKQKNGYLKINEVLSLSSIMFRMKSNALLLTIITTVSALAIGLLSLSFISYYSAEKSAENMVAGDFSLTNTEDATHFKEDLTAAGIEFSETVIPVFQVSANLSTIMETQISEMTRDLRSLSMPLVSEVVVKDLDLSPDETLFTGYSDLLQKFMKLKNSGEVELKGKTEVVSLKYLGLEKEFILSGYYTNGGQPIAIVDDSVFKRLQADQDPAIQKDGSLFIGIEL